MDTIKRATRSILAAFAALGYALAFAQPAFAAMPMPAPADVVKAQGVYALSQLRSLAAVYGADPTGSASREAINNGWAPVARGYASPQHGWPARGPSLGESLEPLLAQAQAARSACQGYEDSCQAESLAWAKARVKGVRAARNPGAELAKVVAEFD